MDPERWKKIDELLDAALELNEEERDAFLEKACARDADLKEQIQKLLASDEVNRTFIETPAYQTAAELIEETHRSLSPGQSMGRYKILSILEAGGMGEVYRAVDPQIGREVAIKLLPAQYIRDEERLSRFEQEIRAVGMLNHPNILVMHDVGRENGTPYLVMELLQGNTLREKLNGGPIGVRKSIDFGLQITHGLSYAHEKGIVHRDLKPENLFITQEGRVKILDFGLAKLTQLEVPAADHMKSPAVVHKTERGAVLGTLAYMSPEQVRGENVDYRTDIFSFGCVLYEMLSGNWPFQGQSQFDVMHAILKLDPPELATTNRQIPPGLDKIVRRCLEKEPQHRFQSTRDLAFALGAISPEATPPRISLKSIEKTGKRVAIFSGSALLLFLIAFFVSRRSTVEQEKKSQPEPFQKMRISQLTTTGKVYDSAISPDGKYLAYVMKKGDTQELWVRQVAATSNAMILPPDAVRFQGITFSRDGNFIYYVVSPQDSPQGTAYRIPILGGLPQKLLENVFSPIAVSPDNTTLAFIGRFELIVSDTSGHSEKAIARPKPGYNYSGSPTWSPDGKKIAVVLESDAGFQDHLIAIDILGKNERSITLKKWYDIESMAWLPTGQGLVVVAKEEGTGYRNYQIWNVSYPDGVVTRITNDLNDYRALSLTSDAKAIIAVRLEQTSHIWITSGRSSKARQITNGVGSLDGLWGLSWTVDGRIVYTSTASGNEDLWITATDGSATKQLTADPMAKIAPSCCHDGRYAVFMTRSGEGTHVWRIGMDGTGLTQLTNGSSEGVPVCSNDGESVIYLAPGAGGWKLWKIPIQGGKSVKLNDQASLAPAISPDGKLIAYAFLNERHQKKIAIISAQGGPPITILPLSSTALIDVGVGLRWTNDKEGIAYVDVNKGVGNLWIQPVDGGEPKQLTSFQSLQIFSFDFFRNGEIAVTRGDLTSDAVLIQDFL